jgi:hypothetical protein
MELAASLAAIFPAFLPDPQRRLATCFLGSALRARARVARSHRIGGTLVEFVVSREKKEKPCFA